MINLRQEALKYHEAGLKVIPVNADKTPACKSWKKYQEDQTKEDVSNLFEKKCWGIALLTGNEIECIDIDNKYSLDGKLNQNYLNLLIHDKIGESFMSKCFIQTTQSEGYHYIFRSSFEDGNKKLASRPATKEEKQRGLKQMVLLETRGNGGYVVISPSEGYLRQSGDLCSLTPVADEERNFAFDCARSFNEVVQPVSNYKKQLVKEYTFNEGQTSWDDFNSKNDAYSMLSTLENVGWVQTHQSGDRIYLRRPDKNKGISGDIHISKNLFKTFSTSTIFESEKGYTPFAVYTMLNHNGDYKLAARDIYNQGYGERLKATNNTAIPVSKKQEISKFENIIATKFDYNSPIEDQKTCFDYVDSNNIYNRFKIGSFGSLGAIVGQQKSRKTTLISSIVAAGLSKQRNLNFELKLENRNVLMFDTEQPYERFQRVNRNILNLAGIRGNSDKFHAFALRSLSRSERVEFISYVVQKYNNIGLIVIDGIVDICLDYMDASKSQDTLEFLMQLSDSTKAMILTVLHLNKDARFVRGHLGTELQNKVDWMIETTKEDGITSVKCRESRFKEFPSFDFKHGENGLPELVYQPELGVKTFLSNSTPSQMIETPNGVLEF